MRNIFAALITLLVLTVSCKNKDNNSYIIGVSQCSDDEWRSQMNNEMNREALFYPGIKIDIRSAGDNNERQISDINYFIEKGVDIIVVSPNEADAITPVIEKAYDAGIPVVLVDRKINSDKYTAYIGADNYEAGAKIGHYICNRLNGKGNIAELTGLHGSTPADERHKGLMSALKEYPDIHIVATADAGWFKESAEAAFDSILGQNRNIDLVFAHNDRMAMGAYEAAKRKGLEKDILFVGVDALAGEGYGIEGVISGILDASFIYPTGGDKVVDLAMNILQGKDFDKENNMSADLVNKANARIMQMQTEHITTLDNKIKVLDNNLDSFLERYSIQRMFLFACIIILILVCILLFFVVKAFWIKTRMNSELSEQKKKLETQKNQLIELSKKLEEATQAKLAFFTNVSHDFRTPLTLIADPVNRLLEDKQMSEGQRHMLNLIHKNVTILLRLINQILDFRKYETGKLNVELSLFDISHKIREWAEAFHSLAGKKNINFSIEIENEDTDDYTMIADAEKLERVTYNLLSNAFKFTPDNGEIKVRLSQFDKDERWLRMTVTDNGIGISKEHIKHIFENFYQADVNFAGSGIGLALVSAFVKLHKGLIEVESESGKGSTFIIELPMKQEVDKMTVSNGHTTEPLFREGALLNASSEENNDCNKEENNENKDTILIIDDNHDVREYIRMLLHDKYNIIEASDGKEGLELAMQNIPDAIICDVMMPVMDGIECCKQIKENMNTSHIPVMMLTAYAGDEQRIESYGCGADSYITKPFSGKLMMTRLQNLIENRKRMQNYFGEKRNEQKEQLCDVDKMFVDKLEKAIEKNLSDSELSVEDLGAQLGLGRVQLYRKTKAITGYSPNELLRITRLKKSSELLRTTDKTIAEITYEVGFSSPSYFTRCYKDYFGENPTDTIKTSKNDNATSDRQN